MPVDLPFVMAGNAPHIPGCRDLSLIGERVARSLFSAHSDRVGRPVTVTVLVAAGIGLFLAAEICRRLGHTLELTSTHGEGTVVNLSIRPQGVHRI